MACFLVSGGEAIVVAGVKAAVKKSEFEKGVIDAQGNQLSDAAVNGVCWTRKLGWLSNMLWGGVLLLFIEHIWHGEIVPWFPYLTAMNTPESTRAMLHELATVGVAMAVLVTIVWAAICVAADILAKRKAVRDASLEA